nr:RNA-directed DNA polymerase, eukaryota, reverse transcriptase zinc-binding domain protein [Tanacetum cinerariifolium]
NEVRYSNERFGSNFNVKGANAFNSLSSITLDRFLSDHRPIFLRESTYDYGPSPFRFFKYWAEVDGFEKLIVETWSDTAACGLNDMLNLMYKLKNLKKKIRGWNSMRQIFKNSKIMLKLKLADVELNRFGRPNKTRHVLVTEFPRQLNSMQRMDMEAEVTIEEIKNAVWDCGTDKSPGPDGFSFDFYRRFWSVIQKEVVAANVVDAGMFKGIVLNSSMVLSYMFFADDAVFVGQRSNSNIDTIIYALKYFERATGFHMNMSKSKIMGIAVNGDKVDQVAHMIGCGILEVPFTYLGSKVGGCMSRIQNWNDVVKNMSSRLSK